MKNKTDTPPDTSPAALIASGLSSFRATVAAMESALSASVLLGSGFAVIMREPYPSGKGVCTRALCRVDPVTRVYSHDAPRCFPSLDLLPNHFAGLCLFTLESAFRVIDAQRGSDYAPGVTFEAMHLREIQAERLARAREMVATLEKCAEKCAATVPAPAPL